MVKKEPKTQKTKEPKAAKGPQSPYKAKGERQGETRGAASVG